MPSYSCLHDMKYRCNRHDKQKLIICKLSKKSRVNYFTTMFSIQIYVFSRKQTISQVNKCFHMCFNVNSWKKRDQMLPIFFRKLYLLKKYMTQKCLWTTYPVPCFEVSHTSSSQSSFSTVNKNSCRNSRSRHFERTREDEDFKIDLEGGSTFVASKKWMKINKYYFIKTLKLN